MAIPYEHLKYFGAERIVRIIKLVESKISTLNDKQLVMKGVIDNKVHIGLDLYWSRTDFVDLVVDVSERSKGEVFTINPKKYEVVDVTKYNLVYRNKQTGELLRVFDGVRLNLDIVEAEMNASGQSTHGYPALNMRFNPPNSWDNPYKRTKVHFFVKAMTEGYTVLLSMGESGKTMMNIHHIKKFKDSRDNSDRNLLILFDEEHKSLPTDLK